MNIYREDFILRGDEPSRLASIVDSSLRVMNEQQFFAWVQGEVQYLLSHEILICGITSGSDSQMQCYRYSSTRYFNMEHFKAVCDPINGLFTQMLLLTRKTGDPCAIGPDVSYGGCHEAWLELLDSCELRNAAGFGLIDSEGRMKSYFCFARIMEELTPRTLYLVEVLIPILDMTLARVISHQGHKARPHFQNFMPLSKREIEVLNSLMAGKSNQVIAQELYLSPLTVKNHVQNIMKKLRVKTRGLAVTTGVRLGLIMSDGESGGEQNA